MCRHDSFQDEIGQSSCKTCQQNEFTFEEGSTECMKEGCICPNGEASDDSFCPKETYFQHKGIRCENIHIEGLFMDRAPDDLISFYINKPTDDSLGNINTKIVGAFVSQNIFGAPWSNGHEQAILPFITTPTSKCSGAFQGSEGYTFLNCWDWLQGWWIPQNQDLEIVGLIFEEPVFISQMETIWTKDTSGTPKDDSQCGNYGLKLLCFI